MQENSILREWYNREVFQKLGKGFREEGGAEQVDFLYDSFVEVVRKGKMKQKKKARTWHVISGATLTSKSYLKAVEDALTKAQSE